MAPGTWRLRPALRTFPIEIGGLQTDLRHPAHRELGARFNQSLSSAWVDDFEGGTEELAGLAWDGSETVLRAGHDEVPMIDVAFDGEIEAPRPRHACCYPGSISQCPWIGHPLTRIRVLVAGGGGQIGTRLCECS
jgi:hypothetical protein